MNVNNLKDARVQNTLLAGWFGIIIGFLILIQSFCVFSLKKGKEEIISQDIEWAPTEMKSRAISKIKGHECCEFLYI